MTEEEQCIDCGMTEEDELQDCEICTKNSCSDCIQTVYLDPILHIYSQYDASGNGLQFVRRLICRQCYSILFVKSLEITGFELT